MWSVEAKDEDRNGYWLRWQVPVCAVIILGPCVIATLTIKTIKESEPLFLDQMWKSKWKQLHPVWLLLYRVAAFVCLSPMLLEILAIDGVFAFYFYTQWTFTLVMVYFAVGTVFSAYGCWVTSKTPAAKNAADAEFLTSDVEDVTNSLRGKQIKGNIKLQSHYTEEAIHHRAGFWGYFMQILYQTTAGAVILTDIVFWCIIAPFVSNAHLGLDLLMGCMHTLNAVFLLLDTALNSLPFPWFRLAYFVQWSCIYVVFQWIIHACGYTWWPYPFLELDTPWAPFWYSVLALVHIPCYGIYALLVKAKESILPRWFPNAFVRSY